MAQESITIARPYAEAVFAAAKQSGRLPQWSDALAFLSLVMTDAAMQDVVGNPKVGKQRLTALLLDIAGERLDAEAQNLVRLLVDNDRIQLLPQIAAHFEQRKHEAQGMLDVSVVSAFPVTDEQKNSLAKALQAKLGREITITTSEDPSLIGGVRIRAGDLVIDGSVQGQLTKLANELGL